MIESTDKQEKRKEIRKNIAKYTECKCKWCVKAMEIELMKLAALEEEQW